MFRKVKLSFKELLLFTIPLVVGQVGQMLFNIGDTFIAGKYSTQALAAIGVGSGITAPFIVLGVASLFAVSSISSRIRGEGNCPDEKSVWGSSLIFCSIISIFLTLALYLLTYNIEVLGLNPEVTADVKTYLLYVGISLVPALFFQNIKEYLQAFEKTVFANALIIFMNVINLIMNWLLMFGFPGFEGLGIKGAAIATVISRTLMAIILWVYAYRVVPCSFRYTKERFKEIVTLGLPIGMGTFVEVLMFSTVTVLIGKMPIHISAAHNIVLNIAGLTFMVPLAINGTAGVKVSYALGQKDVEKMKSYALGCIAMGQGYMLITAATYILIPSFLVTLFTSDPQVIEYGTALFFYVALFQVPDGLQVTMWGILRGMGITKLPLVLTFCSNWFIAIPIGCLLAYQYNMQAKGLWAGLAIGLTIASMTLVYIYLRGLKKLSNDDDSLNLTPESLNNTY